jgi:hypothetical protein
VTAPRAPTPPGSEAPAASGARLGLFLGADFATTTGVAPVAMLGASPFLGWRFLRLAFLRATSGSLDVAGASADFTWYVGHLDACPLTWRTHDLSASACGRVEAGALDVDPSGPIPAPRRQVRPWFAAGLHARGEWALLGPLFVAAELGGTLRLTQDRFYFLPDTTVYDVPVFGASGALGLGTHLL